MRAGERARGRVEKREREKKKERGKRWEETKKSPGTEAQKPHIRPRFLV
jgi:hypothetical protein